MLCESINYVCVCVASQMYNYFKFERGEWFNNTSPSIVYKRQAMMLIMMRTRSCVCGTWDSRHRERENGLNALNSSVSNKMSAWPAPDEKNVCLWISHEMKIKFMRFSTFQMNLSTRLIYLNQVNTSARSPFMFILGSSIFHMIWFHFIPTFTWQ